MRNLIRGATLVLIIAVFILTGCATAKLTKNRQSHTLTEQTKKRNHHRSNRRAVRRDGSEDGELLQGQTITALTQEGSRSRRRKWMFRYRTSLTCRTVLVTRPKDGQASVSVQRNGDNITVTGKCDSIARQCLFTSVRCFDSAARWIV